MIYQLMLYMIQYVTYNWPTVIMFHTKTSTGNTAMIDHESYPQTQ